MIYEIELPDGRIIEVEGEPGQEDLAVQSVREYLAKEGVSKVIEEEDFDYDTGIQNVFLRAQLDMADNLKEKEGVLNKYAGSNGYVRDTKGNLAINPIGQQRLINRGMLDKKLRSNKNIVVDESGFSFSDFADFGGVVGPLAGAIVALTPHGKLLKAMKPFLGSGRIARTAAATIGTAGGQAGEELFETVKGLQQQSLGEVAGEVLVEGAVGGISQGLFEGAGAALHALLGRNASITDVNIARAIASGADPAELEILKNRLGRIPTYADVKKAQKDGTIKFKGTEAAVSQRALDRALAGRTQAASETVFGRTERDNKLIKYGNERFEFMLEKLGDESLALEEIGTKFKAGQLTKSQVDGLIEETSSAAKESNRALDQFSKNIIEQIDSGALTQSPNKRAVGEKIKQEVQNVYERQFGITRNEFGQEVGVGTYVQRSRDIDDFLRTNKLDAVYGKININLNGLSESIDQLVKKNPYLGNLSQLEGVPTNPIGSLQKILKDYKKDGMSIEALNEIRGSILAVKRASGVDAKEIAFALNKVDREIKEIFKRLERGGDFASLGLRATSKLEPEGVARARGRPSKSQLKSEEELAKEQAAENMSEAAKMIRAYNDDYYQAIKPFNNIVVSKIRKEASSGAYDVDDIYKNVVRKDAPSLLRGVLDTLDDASKIEVKRELQKNTIREAVQNSVDDLGNINPVSFAKFFNEKLGTTRQEIFDNIPNFEVILKDFAKINTKLDAKKFSEIVERLQMKDFSSVVGKLVEAENAKHLLSTDKLLTRIVNSDPEEIVTVLFRNGQAGNVSRIKGVVDEDTFARIQQESMRDLLSLAKGPGKQVDEVFKPEALERALNAKGDDVLNEMFGAETTQGLRNLVRDLRVMTSSEGGGAGSLIAGAVAINAFNIAMFPTLIQLGLLGSLMRNPSIVRRLSKPDKESVNIVMQAFKDGLKLFPGISLAQEVQDGSEKLSNIIEEEMGSFNPEIADTVEQLSKEIQPLKTSNKVSLNLPDKIEPIQSPRQGIMSPSILGYNRANEDIARRLSNIA
tara:strand:- start:158 stop:3265 length:3108 start_codon:yes stop_codon:yes gene_type:complete